MFGKSTPRPASRPRKRWWARLRWFALGLLALVCLALVGAIGLQAAGLASRVEAALDVARPGLWAAQFGATAIAWLRWSRIVRWLARTGRIRPSAVEPLIGARHRLLGLVLLIQLTVVLGSPFSLLGSAGGR